MATHPKFDHTGRRRLYLLWFVPIVLVAGTVTLLKPWLRQQDPALSFTVTAVAAVFVMGYSVYIASRMQRRMDEVEVAGQGFATRYGWTWGGIATMVLLMIPPLMDGLVNLVNLQATGSAETLSRRAVRLAFVYGACLVVLVQLVCVMVASLVWGRRMHSESRRS